MAKTQTDDKGSLTTDWEKGKKNSSPADPISPLDRLTPQLSKPQTPKRQQQGKDNEKEQNNCSRKSPHETVNKERFGFIYTCQKGEAKTRLRPPPRHSKAVHSVAQSTLGNEPRPCSTHNSAASAIKAAENAHRFLSPAPLALFSHARQ